MAALPASRRGHPAPKCVAIAAAAADTKSPPLSSMIRVARRLSPKPPPAVVPTTLAVTNVMAPTLDSANGETPTATFRATAGEMTRSAAATMTATGRSAALRQDATAAPATARSTKIVVETRRIDAPSAPPSCAKSSVRRLSHTRWMSHTTRSPPNV